MSLPALDFEKLTADERLRLLEQLWESLDKDPDSFPLTDSERALLDERLDEMECEGPTGIPWEEVLLRIRGKAR
jgi:putative addiction module component (TIGR02574 family)